MEICDGLDNDCDGSIDEDFADLGDDCQVGQGVCENSGTYVCSNDGLSTECNASPGTPQEADEITCDDLDNDCDGQLDEGCDDDGDGWCDENMTISGNPAVCSAGTNAFDCDDNDDTVYPGAPGLCDGKDNDCSGVVDDIKPIGSSTTMTLSNTAGGSMVPPRTMAVPADDDSFCVASVSSFGWTLSVSHVKADGTKTSYDHNLCGGMCASTDRRVVDVGWDGTSCGVLMQNKFADSLRLARWEPGTSSVEVIDPTDGDAYTAKAGGDQDHLSAALYSAKRCYGSLCSDRWFIAYMRSVADGNHDLIYRSVEGRFSSSSTISSSTQIASGLRANTDIELGPSPDANDLWTVMWHDSAGSGDWEAKTVDDGGSLSSNHSGLHIADSNDLREHPQFAEVNGDVYLTIRNSGSNEISIRKVKSNYTYGSTTTVSSSTNQDYVARHLMAPNISSKTWTTSDLVGTTTHTPIAWYMQPYNDQLYQVSSTYQSLGGSGIGSRQGSNSNKGAGDEYLSIRTTGDYLQILRLIDGTDDVAIDELTCH